MERKRKAYREEDNRPQGAKLDAYDTGGSMEVKSGNTSEHLEKKLPKRSSKDGINSKEKNFKEKKNDLLPDADEDQAARTAHREKVKAGATRRQLLSVLGSAAAWYAVTGLAEGVALLPGRTLEAYDTHTIENMLLELVEYSDEKTCTFTERDQRRKDFLEKYGESLEDLFERYIDVFSAPGMVKQLFSDLSHVDCQGLLFAALVKGRRLSDKTNSSVPQAFGSIYRGIRSIFTGRKERDRASVQQYTQDSLPYLLPEYWSQSTYYAIRAADWLPTSKTIHRHEIDPRWNAFRDQGRAQEVSQASTNDTRRRMTNMKGVIAAIETGGWASPERIERFSFYLDNQEVREYLQGTDCTLAEAYSVIKAAVHYEEDQVHHDYLPPTDLIVLLLDQRDRFHQKKILTKDTQSFIQVSYTTKDGSGDFAADRLVQLADAAGVLLERRVVIPTQDTDAEKILASAIADSRGETCIFLDTHGSNETFSLNENKDFTYQELAWSLLERLKATKDPATLGEVTIIIATCHGYNFVTDHVLQELARQYRKTALAKTITWEDIILPTIITETQEEELGWRNFSADFLQYKEAIQKSGGLTGEILLRGIQPLYYRDADMTFFTGEPGEIMEFALRDEAKRGADESVPV